MTKFTNKYFEEMLELMNERIIKEAELKGLNEKISAYEKAADRWKRENGHLPIINNVLKLALTYHWYDETLSGRKRIEYRVICDHWKKIIWDKREQLTHVRFQRGFIIPIQQRTFEIERIDVGECPINGWNEQYYRIHFK